MKRHIKTVHNNNKSFKCIGCDYSGYRKDIIKRHVDNLHCQVKSFKCNECEFATSVNNYMQSHIKTVHNKRNIFFRVRRRWTGY